jgi:hypothetical protein
MLSTVYIYVFFFGTQELNLDDGPRGDMTKSMLYKLSENGVFMYFRWVVFASSPKDQYVPQYSARVQVELLILLPAEEMFNFNVFEIR